MVDKCEKPTCLVEPHYLRGGKSTSSKLILPLLQNGLGPVTRILLRLS
jgi:hypothetical protein